MRVYVPFFACGYHFFAQWLLVLNAVWGLGCGCSFHHSRPPAPPLSVRLLLQARCLLKPRLHYAWAVASLMAHPQLSVHEASGPLAGYCLSAAGAVPSVHLLFLTSRLDGAPPTFPCLPRDFYGLYCKTLFFAIGIFATTLVKCAKVNSHEIYK